MSRSLETPSYSTHPSLTTSETSSIASSELPRTASENYNHSPIPWRAQYATTDKSKEPTERSFQPRFAKRFLRLVGTSHHQPSLSVPTNVLELNAYAARHAAELVEGSPPPSATLDLDRRKVQIPREEAATSWGRTSLASAASSTPLASKHSSLGPLPIFPRPPTHIATLSRQNSLSSSLAQARQQQAPPPEQNSPYQDHNDFPDRSVEDDTRFQTTSSTATWSQELPPRPTAPSPASFASPSTSKPTPKLRPTLASLFQTASRKALKRDEFRKDSYRREEPAQHQPEPESFIPSSSVPSTPLRKRFLALKSLNATDFLRSAKSSPAPPLPTVMTPSSPIVPLPVPSSGRKAKENSIPSTPILRRKRSSLPTPSPHPDNQYHHHHHHHHHHHQHDHYSSQDHGYHVHDEAQHVEPLPAMNGRGDLTRALYQDSLEVPNGNACAVRRSRSDSKHKRSHSPGLTTSIKVPGPPPQHHPHPHPFFPCDTPLDRGLLALPSFDFERPLTRPSTPGQSTEFLPMDKGRKPRLRGVEVDSSINAEIRSVLAAGTEARRERRAPSRERLRVIGPMHRQHLPDVTGGDDQLSPDPTMEPVMMSQPVNIPSSSRSRGHMGHGLLPFESPAATPYGSKIDLPLTPPASKTRRGSLPQPPFTPNSNRTHHRQFSSTTTAVASPAPPLPPKDHRPSVEYPDNVIDEEVGILKDYNPPKLYTGFKPIKEKRSALPYTPVSTYDHHQPKPVPVVVVDHNPTIHYRKASLDYNGREPIMTPSSSYRHHHFHSHSLSGSTVQGGGAYPTPAQSPAGLGISLYSEQMRPPSRQDRFYDLREALKLSLADSRYRTFERALRRYHDHRIPLQGTDGLFDRVQRLLNDAVDDGLPPQTALKYFHTFQSLLTDQ